MDVGGREYRGRVVSLDEPGGRRPELAILRPAAPFSEHIADNRLLIAGFLALFVLLALASATFVSRALTGQIATFLAAARRLSRGDFRQLVPVEGNDEFAQLGREFNDMSEQLEAKIEEVERKRQELEETIRRVGDALATGLDRDGVVALAVRQAVDACDAEVGRALPLARGAFARYEVGPVAGELERVIETAERDVFVVQGRTLGRSCWARSRATRARNARGAPCRRRRAARTRCRSGLRSLVDGPEYLGAISIARRAGAVHARGGRAARVPRRAGSGLDREREPPRDGRAAGGHGRPHGPRERARVHLDPRPRAGAQPTLRHPARPGDAGHRRLQAGERHLRPPAGRRGPRAGGGRAADPLPRSRRPGAVRRGGAGSGAAADGRRGSGAACGAHEGGGRGSPGPAGPRRRVTRRDGELRRGLGAGYRSRPRQPDRGRRRRALPGEADRQEPRGTRSGSSSPEPSSRPR